LCETARAEIAVRVKRHVNLSRFVSK